MINGLIFVGYSFMLILMAFFKFCAQNSQKMFYWLNIMDYDSETRCYFNMNLNELDSKGFIKRSLFFINAVKCFTLVFMPFFIIAACISVFIHLNDYYLNHFIGILIYFIVLYQGIAYAFGLPIILYKVSINLVNDIFNPSYDCF